MFSFDRAADAFTALSDPSRLKIYTTLVIESGKCDLDETLPVAMNTVTGLTKLSGLAQSTVSHHVRKLKEAELVEEHPKGGKKYLFPVKSGIEYNRYITDLFTEALQNDKTLYTDILPGYTFEQKDFTEAVEFLALNDFLLQGPTSLDSSYGAVRFHLYNPKRKDTISIELTYTPVNGELHIGHLKRFTSLLESDIKRLKNLISRFVSAKA
ncbi:MAG: Helix-turn-helix domain protein [candidate division WS6 bacterium OLB20]|uniref:Helix-turn-helix domain protein n=1 Tax=candidate division WS6 bacterium OLB20 TaxID=1617426 RepID=A0A136LZA9_9BACT|nr:MAG: Helix-turn-helix domain protein [candidate division WS6 bacterium OLB20]